MRAGHDRTRSGFAHSVAGDTSTWGTGVVSRRNTFSVSIIHSINSATYTQKNLSSCLIKRIRHVIRNVTRLPEHSRQHPDLVGKEQVTGGHGCGRHCMSLLVQRQIWHLSRNCSPSEKVLPRKSHPLISTDDLKSTKWKQRIYHRKTRIQINFPLFHMFYMKTKTLQ